MQLKTSSFSQGIIRQNIRSLSWIGLLYFLILQFILPLQFILKYDARITHSMPFFEKNLFMILDPIQSILIFVVPVLTALVLFRYLHVKGSADFIHSLPIKREVIYFQNIVYGMFILIVPVLITGLLLIMFYNFFHVFPTITIGEIWSWIGTTILFNLFVFFVATFIGMITGLTAVQAVITYLIFVLPFGFFSLTVFNMEHYLFGFSSQYYMNSNVENIVPFVRVATLGNHSLSSKEITFYLGLTVIFALLSLITYKNRNIESAEQPIAFRKLRPYFKYILALFCMLFGGFYIGEFKNDMAWIVIGMISASLIGYYIAEMILNKTWRVLKKWKGYFYFLISVAIVGGLFLAFGSSFEQKIPEATEVDSAYLGQDVFSLREELDTDIYSQFHNSNNIFLRDKQNIHRIIEAQKQILTRQSEIEKQSLSKTRNVVLAYKLQSGKTLVREYQIPKTDYIKYFAAVGESEEYKLQHYSLLRLNHVDEVKRVSFHPYAPIPNPIILTDTTKINELVTILQEEMKEETGGSMIDSVGTWAGIELFISPKDQIHVDWKKSYRRVNEWLVENNMVKNARITAESISKIIVARNEKDYYNSVETPSDIVLAKEIENMGGTLVITDINQMNEIIQGTSYTDERDYLVAIYYKNGIEEATIEFYSEQDVPPFIREFFQ